MSIHPDAEIVEAPWSGDLPLGRHIHHDPRSRQYRALAAAADVPIRRVSHRRHGKPFQQTLGSCTVQAGCGMLMCDPFWRWGRNFTQARMEGVYYPEVTRMDPFEGEYPPTDTGSDGLTVCKLLQRRKFIRGYEWAFGATEGRRLLQGKPVMIGTWWYDSMDKPDSSGLVTVSPNAGRRGGHEYLWVGTDPELQLDEFWNSWGLWGLKGRFFMPWRTTDRLVSEGGDLVSGVA